uniref:Synaptic vesicle glycoprotein 2A n=1 Tax=Malurus cyaneus samueli TaxID=2593467 RepID=A0A8C5TF34_9PASS
MNSVRGSCGEQTQKLELLVKAETGFGGLWGAVFDGFPAFCDVSLTPPPPKSQGVPVPPIPEIWQTWDRGRAWVWAPWEHICPPCPTVLEQSGGTTRTTHHMGFCPLPSRGPSILSRGSLPTPHSQCKDALPLSGGSGCRSLGPLGLTLLSPSPGLIVYLGMMVGAFVWGGLADRLGRRQCLLISLSVNSVFAFFSSFVQGYGTFLFCRLLSGVGIGGSIPIVFSYFSEFLAQEKRGEHLSWLCMFWMIGGIYASAMAWAIIPHYGWSFQMGSAYQFHSWRVFVLVCAFPSVFAIGALTTMPESPRFYLEVRGWGGTTAFWGNPKRIRDLEWRGDPGKNPQVTHIKTIKREDELIEIQSDTGTWYRRWLVRCLNLNFQQCFAPEYRRVTLMMMAVWFTMSFRCCRLLWAHRVVSDMIKHLQSIEYVRHFTFNFTLENQVYGLKMKSVTFEDSLFEEYCTFISTVFYNTDFFEYKFINSRVVNSTFLHNKEGCQLDFSDDNNAYMIYFVSFLGTLAVLPGNIVSALLMDKIGRLRMLAGSSVMSCVSCFFLSFGNSESAMIALLCLFGGVSIAPGMRSMCSPWTVPSDKRWGIWVLNALCKLAAVLAISIFTSFVGITKAVPSVRLGCAGPSAAPALKLPETRGQVLQ